MSIYCDRGQHHRCFACDTCVCHEDQPKKKKKVKREPVDVSDESEDAA